MEIDYKEPEKPCFFSQVFKMDSIIGQKTKYNIEIFEKDYQLT